MRDPCEVTYSECLKVPSTLTGVDIGYFGAGGGDGGGWYPGVEKQWGMLPNCFNLRIGTLLRNTSNATK